MPKRIAYSPKARAALSGILEYHRSIQESERGDKIVRSLRDSVKILAGNPGFGRYLQQASRSRQAEVRAYLHFQTYWIIYEDTGEFLNVLEIRHGSRFPSALLD